MQLNKVAFLTLLLTFVFGCTFTPNGKNILSFPYKKEMTKHRYSSVTTQFVHYYSHSLEYETKHPLISISITHGVLRKKYYQPHPLPPISEITSRIYGTNIKELQHTKSLHIIQYDRIAGRCIKFQKGFGPQIEAGDDTLRFQTRVSGSICSTPSNNTKLNSFALDFINKITLSKT